MCRYKYFPNRTRKQTLVYSWLAAWTAEGNEVSDLEGSIAKTFRFRIPGFEFWMYSFGLSFWGGAC